MRSPCSIIVLFLLSFVVPSTLHAFRPNGHRYRTLLRRPSSFTKIWNNIPNVLLVECGFGNDSHGQNATKAAMKACRNAIEFNSISIQRMIPGGYDEMKVHVILGVPEQYNQVDLAQVAKVFPFGKVTLEVTNGGLVAPSGRVLKELGDTNDDMVIVCAAVQVGY